MSATIEERVVAMKFDNSNFEKNVKTSMSTLDKLKEALNFNSAKDSVKTLNEATKSVDFSKMANSIDTISDRFSALGVVGMSVLNNLTNKATDAALDILGKVPSMIIQGGWKRATDVEQARFTLQGVVGDVEEVKRIMDDASDSVNGTAYAYNEAAKAASVFAASGLRSGEQMQGVLKAVAGTAATANADYEGIAHIFQTIAGQGRVMGEQLNQFANRGINAAATLSNYFNGVMEGSIGASDAVTEAIFEITDGYEVTEGDIRDFASKSLISFDIFSEAMSTTFGDHAKDANKTFSGAMANIRAALARTGEAFFKYIVEEEGPAVQLFNAIRIKINDMNKAWAPAAEAAAMAVNKIISSLADLVNNIPMINITHTLLNLFKILGNVLRPFAQVIWSIGEAFGYAFDFGTISKSFYDITYQIEQFTKGLAFSEDAIKGVTNLFKGFFLIIDAVADIIFDFVSQLKLAEVPFQSFTDIIGHFLGGIGDVLTDISLTIRRSTGLKNAFSKLADTLNKFGEVISSIFRIVVSLFSDLVSISGEATEGIGEFVGAFVSRGIEIFATVLEKVVDLLELFRKNILVPGLEVFTVLILSAAEALEEFFYGIRKSERIQKAFEKISSAMERLFTAVKNIFKPLTDIFSDFHINARQASESVGGFLASLAIDAVTTFVEALAKVIEFLEKIAEKFIIPALDIFIENIGKATSKMVELAETHSFTDVLDNIKEKLSAVAEGFKGFFSSLDENDGILYRAVEGLKKMYENFKLLQGGASAHTLYDEETGEFIETVDEMSEKESIISKIGGVFKVFGENVKDAMKNAYEAVKSFIDYILTASPGQIADDIKESLIKLKDKLSELIDKFKSWAQVTGESAEGIRNPFEGATTAIKNFFTELDTDKIIAIIFTGVMIAMLVSILKMTNAFTGLLKGITGAVDGFKKVTESISGFFDRLKNPQKSKILEFAEAIALVAAALVVLTLVDQSKLWNSVKVLGVVSVVLIALSAVLAFIAKFVKGKELEKSIASLSRAIISISASVLILSVAVKILESIDFLAAEKAVLVIAELGLIMIGLSTILTKFVKGSIKGFLTMLAFAAVITRFAKALETITKLDFANIQNNLEGFAIAFGGLALVAWAASQMKLTAGLGLLIFVYALQKILPMLNELSIEVDVQRILDLIRDNIDLVYAIGGLVAAMIVISGIFGKGIKNFGTGMILLGISAALMAHAIKTIGAIDPSVIEAGTKAILKIMAMFAVLALVLQISKDQNHALKIAAAIGALTLCLYPIAGAIWIIGSMDSKKASQGLFAVSVVMAMFALITKAAASGNGAVGVGQMIIVTIALLGLMGEMIALTFIPYGQILAAAGSMALVMFAFAIVLDAVGSINKVSKSAMATLIELAIMTGALAYALYKMSTQPWENMLGAAGSIAIVILALAKVVDMLDIVDWENALGSVTAVLYLCIALIPVGLALWKLSAYDWQGMVGAAVSIGITLLALGKTVEIINEVDWANAIGGASALIVLCVALLPIGLALWKLSAYDWQGMVGAAVSIGITLLALAGSVAILAKSNNNDLKSMIISAGSLLILTLAMTPIVKAINSIKDSPFKQLVGAAASMALVLLALAESVKIMMGFSNWKSGIIGAVACYILARSLKPVAKALNELRGFKWDELLASAAALSIVLIAMSGVTILLSKFNVDAGAAIKGAFAVVAVTAILIGLTGALAGLAGWLINDNMAGYIERGLDLMVMIAGKMGDAIGAFLGGIIGGAGMKILEDIGIGLSLFAYYTEPFTTWVKTIDDDTVKGVKNLAKSLVVFGGSALISSLTAFIGLPSLFLVPLQMKRIGGALQYFSEAIEGVNLNNVATGAKAASDLMSIKAPRSGGLIEILITGVNDFGLFDADMFGENGLGGGLKAFAEQVEGITEESVAGGIAVAEALFGLKAPRSGGFFEIVFAGVNDFGMFDKDVFGKNGLGGGIRAFARQIGGITEESVAGGIAVAEALLDLKAPRSGGLLEILFAGVNDLGMFDKDVFGKNGLGGGIRAFANQVKEVDENAANSAIRIAKKLFDLDAPRSGGIFEILFAGVNDLGMFDADVFGEKGLGGGIKAFIEQVRDFDKKDIAAAHVAAKTLEVLTHIDIPDEKLGIFDLMDRLFYGDNKDYEGFSNSLTALGNGLFAFYNSVKDIDMEITKDAQKILTNLQVIMHNAELIDTKKVDDFIAAMGKLATDGIKKFCVQFRTEENVERINKAMDTFMKKVVHAIRINKKTATAEMSSFSDEMVSTYTSQVSSYNTAGFNNSDSYIQGFMSNQDLANFSMEDFANGNYEALTGANGFDFDGDYSNMFGDLGQFNYESYMDSFMGNQDLANFNMEQFAQGNLEALMGANAFDIDGDVSKVMEEIGNISADSLIGGLGDISSYANLGTLESSAKTTVDKINDTFNTELSYDNFKQKADSIVQGLSNGMDTYSYIAENSAVNLASKIAQKFANFNQINSPSKLYARFGEYLDEGLAIGIDDYASEPVEAISDVGNSMYDSLRNAMDESSNYISENVDLNPTITPYVDITGAMRDVQQLNSMFDNTLLAYDMQSRFGDMAGDGEAVDATNSDVVSAITTLRGDLSDLKKVVGNLQVVMDTGTLVGEIAPGMDSALGQMAMLKRRGV